MNCPTCKAQMKKVSWSISSNLDTGKKYDRTLFQCATDDIWIVTEIPVEESSE